MSAIPTNVRVETKQSDTSRRKRCFHPPRPPTGSQ